MAEDAANSVEKRLKEVKQQLAQPLGRGTGEVLAEQRPKLNAERQKLEAALPKLKAAAAELRAGASVMIAAARNEAKVAVGKERLANLAAPGSKPFPSAESSFEQIEQMDPASQQKLLGAPLVRDTLGEVAARKVQQRAGNPVEAATVLAAEVQARGNTRMQKLQTLKAAGPAIAQLTAGMMSATDKDAAQALISLAHATESAGPEGSQGVARHMLEQVGSTDGKTLARAFGVAVRDGAGVQLGVELARQLKTVGKLDEAAQIEKAIAGGMTSLHADFNAAQKKVARLNMELGQLVQGFGPLMTSEQVVRAVDGFKKQHKTEYANVESSSQKLAGILDGAASAFDDNRINKTPGPLAIAARKVLSDARALAQTTAGRAQVQKALIEDGAGGHSFLHTLEKSGTLIEHGAAGATLVSTIVTQSIGVYAVQLAKGGRLADAKSLLDGMARHPVAFGVDPGGMKEVLGKMDRVIAGDAGAVADLRKQLYSTEAGMPGAGHHGAVALEGLGAALAVVEAVKDWKKGDPDVRSILQTAVSTANAGVETGKFLFQVFATNPAASELFTALELGGKGISLATAAFDTLDAVEAFANGQGYRGTASAASAIGGAMMVVPAMQIPGAVLSLGAMGLKYYASERALNKAEAAAEKDGRAFLEAAGIAPAQARQLSDLTRSGHRSVGPFIAQLAGYLNLPPQALFSHLAGMSDAQLDGFVERVKDLPSKKGVYARTAPTDARAMADIGGWGQPPQSIEAMRAWMKHEKLLPD